MRPRKTVWPGVEDGAAVSRLPCAPCAGREAAGRIDAASFRGSDRGGPSGFWRWTGSACLASGTGPDRGGQLQREGRVDGLSFRGQDRTGRVSFTGWTRRGVRASAGSCRTLRALLGVAGFCGPSFTGRTANDVAASQGRSGQRLWLPAGGPGGRAGLLRVLRGVAGLCWTQRAGWASELHRTGEAGRLCGLLPDSAGRCFRCWTRCTARWTRLGDRWGPPPARAVTPYHQRT